MSTYELLEARAKRRMGRRGMTITTEFLDEMQAAQLVLEKGPTLPKWLKTTTDQITTVASEGFLTDLPPTGFLRVYDDNGLMFLTEGGTPKRALRAVTMEEINYRRLNGSAEGHIYYFIDSDAGTKKIAIGPIQTRDVNFYMNYYAKEDTFDGENTNNWCAEEPDLILGEAGIQLAIWLRDDRALKYFQDIRQRGLNQMIRQVEADEWGDQNLQMGGPD